MKNIKVIHIPGFNDPYQRSLSKHLTQAGVSNRIEKQIAPFDFLDITPICILLRNPRFAVLHLHWQHPFLLGNSRLATIIKSTFFISQLLLLKVFRKKIVWTVHNLSNHEKQHEQLELFFSRFVARIADHIIAMCNSGKRSVASAYRIGEAKIAVIPHGNFIKLFSNKVEQKQAKQLLNLSSGKTLFVYLGLIRPYKGVPQLIESFRSLRNSEAHLLVAGRTKDIVLERQLEKLASDDEHITLDLRYIPDDEMVVYVNASDVFVCPYLDILNSGGVIMGMSYAKPIVAPRLGCIPEILEEKNNFLYDRKDEAGLRIALTKALEQRKYLTNMGAANLIRVNRFDWSSIAEATAKLYS